MKQNVLENARVRHEQNLNHTKKIDQLFEKNNIMKERTIDQIDGIRANKYDQI